MPRGWSATPTVRAERVELAAIGRRWRATRLPRSLDRWWRGAWGGAPDETIPAECELAIAWRAQARWQVAPRLDTTHGTSPAAVALEWRRHGDRWWSAAHGSAGLELVLHPNHARIQLWGAPWADAPGLAGARAALLHALHAAIAEALRSRGVVPLHAVVVARDGDATALLGLRLPERGGALLAAVHAGWLPLAQDLAWLEPASRRIHAWRGERGIRIDDGRMLPYAAIAAVRPLVARLTRVVLVDDSRTHPSARVTAREAAAALWRSAGVPLCHVSARAFACQLPELLSTLEWRRSLSVDDAPPR